VPNRHSKFRALQPKRKVAKTRVAPSVLACHHTVAWHPAGPFLPSDARDGVLFFFDSLGDYQWHAR
jgi:hypothetical protein